MHRRRLEHRRRADWLSLEHLVGLAGRGSLEHLGKLGISANLRVIHYGVDCQNHRDQGNKQTAESFTHWRHILVIDMAGDQDDRGKDQQATQKNQESMQDAPE